MSLGSLWLLRIAAVITWAVAVLDWLAISSWRNGLDELIARFGPVALALPALLWLLEPRARLGRRDYAVFALLLVIAAFHTPDLQYPVAAVLPLLMPPRRAVAWLASVDAISLPWLTFQVFLAPGENGLASDAGPGAIAGVIAAHLGWQLFAFAIGGVAAQERRQRRETAQLNAELIATRGLLADSARLAQQRELSRELHDALGHHLAALHVQLELAHGVATGRARDAIDDARRAAHALGRDVRGAVGALRTRDAIDLRAALTTLARGVQGPRIHLALDAAPALTDAARAHALFRCAQEALTNAVRHAGAQQVWVDLARRADGVELRVRDDGRGDPAPRLGHGLRGMRERLEALGGRLELASSAGFTVIAWLPGEAAP